MMRLLAVSLVCLGWAWAGGVSTRANLGLGCRSLKLEEAVKGAPVFTLLQGREGRVWAGTGGGLAVFTGMTWRIVPIGPEGRLFSVRSLLEGADGSLWVGTDRNWLWRLKDGRWTCHCPRTGVALASERVQTLLETRRPSGGTELWVGTERGLACLRGERWQYYGVADGLDNFMIWKLREVREPGGALGLWAATAGGVMRHRGGRWERMDAALGPARTANDLLSVPAPQGGFELWVSYWNEGLACWDGRTWKAHGPGQGFPSRNPTSLAYTQKGSRPTIWAGTYEGGLAWFDGTWHRFGKPEGFPSPNVLEVQAMATERPSLLVGTRNAGVVVVDPGGWAALGEAQGLPNEIVTCFTEERRGSKAPALWIGTAGGLARWEPETGRLTAQAQALPSANVRALLANPGGQPALWAGTARGLMSFDGSRWRLLGAREGFPEVLAGQLAETTDEHGERTVWVGYATGLAWLTRGAWHFELAPGHQPDSGTAHLLVAKDPDGGTSLWVATRAHGLRRFRKGVWTHYGLEEGLPSLSLTALQSFSGPSTGAWLLAGTATGEMACLSLDRPGARWSLLSKAGLPALPDSPITGIQTDAWGRVYLMSQQGITVASLTRSGGSLEPETLDTCTWGDGLPSTACNAGFKDAQGRIWAGTPNGAAVLAPSGEAPQAPSLPAPRLRAELLPGRTRVLDGATLRYRQNHLMVQFSLPIHRRFEDTLFRTELVGLEEPGRWTPSASRELTSLPAGSHLLRVWTRDYRGTGSGPSEFRVRILPAPWFSPWAWACYVLAFATLVVAYLKARTRFLRLRNQALERVVEARTRELAATNRALAEQNLRDPLTGLRNRRYVDEVLGSEVAQVVRAFHPAPDGTAPASANQAMLFIMIDLDHFKAVNDHHGHRAGDAVLVQTARIICATMRASDSIVRWGGEEFLGIARGLTAAEAPALAERIRQGIEGHPFDLQGGAPIRLTCSIGFAAFPPISGRPEALTWEQTLHLADACLYEAKHGGRNRWVGLLPRTGPGDLAAGAVPEARAMAEAGLMDWLESGTA